MKSSNGSIPRRSNLSAPRQVVGVAPEPLPAPAAFDKETEQIILKKGDPSVSLGLQIAGNKVTWPVNSNARTREKAKEISKSRIPNFPNFLGLVLGCIEAKFCK